MTRGPAMPLQARSRRALTLVELLVSIAVTALVAASVAATVSAVGVGLRDQDDAAQEVARLARAQARIADHLYRARMVLAQSETVATMWIPSEEFNGSPTNATDYDAIHGKELRWYRVDRTNRIVTMQRTTDTANATVYPLSTDWAALRTTLANSGALTTVTVLEGVLEGAFRFTTFTPCDDRRLVLEVQLDDQHGGAHLELGGLVDSLQEHPDCQ